MQDTITYSFENACKDLKGFQVENAHFLKTLYNNMKTYTEYGFKVIIPTNHQVEYESAYKKYFETEDTSVLDIFVQDDDSVSE